MPAMVAGSLLVVLIGGFGISVPTRTLPPVRATNRPTWNRPR